MGRTIRWFRGLLGLNKLDDPPPSSTTNKRRWSFLMRPYGEEPTPVVSEPATAASRQHPNKKNNHHHWPCSDPRTRPKPHGRTPSTTPSEPCHMEKGLVIDGANKRAIAFSAAALVIQSHFRRYLATRALRALKGLVKLQALVRGHIVRKRTAETVRCMQALVSAQTRARVMVRARVCQSPHSSGNSSHTEYLATPEKFKQIVRTRNQKHDQSWKLRANDYRSKGRDAINHDRRHYSSTWLDPRMVERVWDHRGPSLSPEDNTTGRVVDIDPGKPMSISKYRNPVLESPYSPGLTPEQAYHIHDHTTSTDPAAAQSYAIEPWNHLKLMQEEGLYCTAESSLQFCSSSSRGMSSRLGLHTPAKSDGSATFMSGYSEYRPHYMAYTESAKAKLRSASAPRQRPDRERTGSTNKYYSVPAFVDSGSKHKWDCDIHAVFSGKEYPGSGRLDRLGMPVGGNMFGCHHGRYLN